MENPVNTENFSRDALLRTKDLLLSSLKVETDRETLKGGIEKLANINASLRRCDDLDAAREELAAVQRQTALSQRSQAERNQEIYRENCYRIVNAVLAKDKDYLGRMVTDHSPQSPTNLKMFSEYSAKIVGVLSFEDAAKQADEILTASIRQRPWEDLIGLPVPIIRQAGGTINRFGSYEPG